jgi:hypothetical protein
MTWYCDLGHQEPVQFDNETDWREHMMDLSLHPSRSKPPTGAQLDVLVVRKQQLAPRDPGVCPFCEDKPNAITMLGDRGNPADIATMLTNHIAEHVKALSFLSLPSFGDEDFGDDKNSANPADSSAKRLVRDANSSQQPPSGIEMLEDISLPLDSEPPEPELAEEPPDGDPMDLDYDAVERSEHESSASATPPVPDTETNFSWDFMPPRNIALGAVDAAFQQWHDHPSSIPVSGQPYGEGSKAGPYCKYMYRRETALPWPQSNPETIVIVPYHRNPNFVGRSEILGQLKGQLGHGQSNERESNQDVQLRASLAGPPGIG